MILLDTCVLVWLDSAPERISQAASGLIRGNVEDLWVTAASALEIAIKARKGKLVLPRPAEAWFPAALAAHGIGEVAISSDVAIASAALPPLHNDPFDRIIIATAARNGATLLTPDEHIHQYRECTCVW